MRAMWKGALAFGLVNVPVKLYAATEDHDIRFHQVHAKDNGRIQYKRVCTECGETVEYKDIAKAYETPTGQRVVFDEQDFASLPVPTDKEIEVVEFVPSEQVDPLLFAKSYYLEPDARARKPYALLREALVSTDRTAIVRIVFRQKEQLAALRVRDDVMVLQTMLWPDEIRQPQFDGLDAEIRPQELAMAQSLIENLSKDFEPEEFHDTYREALEAIIEEKLSGGQVVASKEEKAEDTAGQVVDLMAALKASVEKTRAERDGGTGASGAAAQPEPESKPTRRTSARPTPAKKAAAPPAARTSQESTQDGETEPTTPKPRTRKTAAKAPAKKATRRSA